jgi:hypothetical protein
LKTSDKTSNTTTMTFLICVCVSSGRESFQRPSRVLSPDAQAKRGGLFQLCFAARNQD